MQLFSEYRCKERKAGSGRLEGISVTNRVMKMTVHYRILQKTKRGIVLLINSTR